MESNRTASNLQWRPRARIIAWLEFFLPAAALIHAIYEVSSANKYYTHWLVYASAGVTLVEAAAEIWAAAILWGATNADTEPNECLRRGGNWRIVLVTLEVVEVFMIILEIIFSFFQGAFIRTIIMVILHGVFIFVVESFMSEVRPMAGSNNQNQGTDAESPPPAIAVNAVA